MEASNKAQTFFVATDGSDASELAFQVCAKDMMREDIDHIVVGHISDKKKDYLPWNMKPQYVNDIYEAKVMPFGKHGRYAHREKEESQTSKEAVWALAEFEKASIIVVGNHGRKGPKADLTVCGTAIEFLSLNSKFPCLIIKDRKARSQKPDGALRWGVCYDGSDKAKEALELTLKTMRTNDKLAVVTVKDAKVDNEDVVKAHVKNMCEKYEITKVEVTILDKEEGKSVYQVIKKYLKYQASDITKHGYIDFVTVGNTGVNFSSYNKKYLGSVAEAVLRARLMNCLLVI